MVTSRESVTKSSHEKWNASLFTPCNGHTIESSICENKLCFSDEFCSWWAKEIYDLNYSRHVFPMCMSSRFIGNSRFSPSLILSKAKTITAREDSTDVYIIWSSGSPFETLWILCNINYMGFH